MKKIMLMALAGLTCMPAHAQTEIRYVSCPIYRDTDSGKKSGCWLVDDHENGVRYDVSMAPSKPDWNYAVLVDGKLAPAAKINACGGVLLNPVRVSVLHDQPCTRKMLPAETYLGHPYVLPARNMRPLYEKRKPIPKPYLVKDYAIPFDYDSSFLIYQLSDYYIDQAVSYALASHAKAVNITGWAATAPEMVSGDKIQESADLASLRAELVRRWMVDLGVPPATLHVTWKVNAQPAPIEGADGLRAPSRRRTDIEIIPGSSQP